MINDLLMKKLFDKLLINNCTINNENNRKINYIFNNKLILKLIPNILKMHKRLNPQLSLYLIILFIFMTSSILYSSGHVTSNHNTFFQGHSEIKGKNITNRPTNFDDMKLIQNINAPTFITTETLSSNSDSSVFSRRTGGVFVTNNDKNDGFWGTHPISWPLETFRGINTRSNVRWLVYFHDQTMAIVLQTPKGKMYNCTLLEVIPKMQQLEVMKKLGYEMPLKPLNLHDMIHLVSLCGEVDHLNHPVIHSYNTEILTTTAPTVQDVLFTAINGILPGTLWCGSGDIAQVYENLGFNDQLDLCCRAHDFCPVKLRPFTTRYGFTNLALSSRSHCACDMEFFRCLKRNTDNLSETIGLLYFNVMNIQCLQDELTTKYEPPSNFQSPYNSQHKVNYQPVGHVDESSYTSYNGEHTIDSPTKKVSFTKRLECTAKDGEGFCRMWLPNPKGFDKKLTLTETTLTF